MSADGYKWGEQRDQIGGQWDQMRDNGIIPAFSARVVGMTSRASAKAWTQIASMPERVRPYFERDWETSISGAPPPAMSALEIRPSNGKYKQKDRNDGEFKN